MDEMNLNCGVYQIRNIITNVCYSGQSIHLKQRPRQHWSLLKNNKHTNSYLQNSYNKHGKECFVFEVLIYCKPEDLTLYEQLFYDIDKSHGLSYNTRDCVDSNRGIKRTTETRKRISESHVDNSGENNPNWGKHPSDESRKKMGKAQRGRRHSKETKNKMSKNHADVGGINHPRIIKKEIILKILELLEEGMSVIKILKEISVCERTVYKAKNGFYNNIYDLEDHIKGE